jgi:hypothetical protein
MLGGRAGGREQETHWSQRLVAPKTIASTEQLKHCRQRPLAVHTERWRASANAE